MNLIGIPLNFSEVNDSEIDLQKTRNKFIKDNLTIKEKKDENPEIPRRNEEIDAKKVNVNKFAFYGSSDDFISEAISRHILKSSARRILGNRAIKNIIFFIVLSLLSDKLVCK